MNKEILAFSIFMLFIASAISVSGSLTQTEPLSMDWLIMVYLDGDNDKWSRAAADLDEIITPRTAPRVDITILYDTHDADDHSGTTLYHMKGSTLSEHMLSWGGGATELNMGDGDNLEEFIDWSLDHFQGDRNMLILWDHGSSWKGCCEDESDSDMLRADEIRTAFDNALGSLNLDILQMAACSMADIEMCYELHEYVDYYIGSEYVGWYEGSTHGFPCDFNQIISGINTDNSDPVEDICQRIIDNAIAPNCVSMLPDKSHTFSVIKMNEMDDLIETLDAFALDLIDHFTDPTIDPQYTNDIITARKRSPSWSSSRRTDIRDFAERLGESTIPASVSDAVAYEWHHQGSDDATVEHAHGLHICFPKYESDWSPDYLGTTWIEHFRNDCHWDEWLTLYYDTTFVDDDFTSSFPCWEDTIFDNINDAIDAIFLGDTIWVFDGNYDETVMLDRRVNLAGAGDHVIIDCDLLTYGMMIYSEYTSVSGFWFDDELYGLWGIQVNVDHCTIQENIFTNLDYGVTVLGSSDTVIKDNWFEHNDYGVYLVGGSNNNLIYNNYFNNTVNAYDNGINQWNITKVKEKNIIGWPWTAGNYWSDYLGQDTDPTVAKDALGDSLTPHNCSGNIQTGGDREPLLRTVCMDIIEIGLAENPGLYILDKFYPADVLKNPVIIGPVSVPIDVMDKAGMIIDHITVTVNGRKIWELDGPIVEPPIHHWKNLCFGKYTYVVTTTDIKDTTVEHMMTAWKFF